MMATYHGTVTGGYDGIGAFSQGGADLAGKNFVASFKYDTTHGGGFTGPGIDQRAGPSGSDNNTYAIKSASLTIDDRTFQFYDASIQSVRITDGSNQQFWPDPTFHNIYANGFPHSTDPFTDFRLEVTAPMPSDGLDTPFSITTPGVQSGHAAVFNQRTGSYDFDLALAPTSLSVERLDAFYGPASVAELARASADVYAGAASAFGHFSPLGEPTAFGDGLKVQAYGTPDEGNIVLAFQGTNSFKDWIVNGSISGITNDATLDYAGQAIQILKDYALEHPTANIQLTGHSLGGALAQVVGAATGVSSTAFDAPGAAELYAALGGLPLDAPALGNAQIGTNYRLYGDQVSLLGSQLGSVITVGDESSYCCVPLSEIDLKNINAAHSYDTLASLIGSGATLSDGLHGPNHLGDYDVLIPAGGVFAYLVSALTPYDLDPTPGYEFTFTSEAGSPFFSWLTLPSMDGVDRYELNFRTNGNWIGGTFLDPLQRLDLMYGVDAFRFAGLDGHGRRVLISDGFFVDAGFASAGQFNGRLEIVGSAAVPEPASWAILIVGFGIAGWHLRSRGRTIRRRGPAQWPAARAH